MFICGNCTSSWDRPIDPRNVLSQREWYLGYLRGRGFAGRAMRGGSGRLPTEWSRASTFISVLIPECQSINKSVPAPSCFVLHDLAERQRHQRRYVAPKVITAVVPLGRAYPLLSAAH